MVVPSSNGIESSVFSRLTRSAIGGAAGEQAQEEARPMRNLRTARLLSMTVLAALLLAALVFLQAGPPVAEAQSPPDSVSSVSVTRADGSLTASWSAPARATSYHVTYSSDHGSSWSLAALNHTGTSIGISVDNAKTYVVGVRARNSAGDSGWVNSPAAGPYVPPGSTPPPPPPQSPRLA